MKTIQKNKNFSLGLNYNNNNIYLSDTPNGHVFMLGKSGSGKTYCLYNLLVQAIASGRSVIIIDVEHSFDIRQIPDTVMEMLDGKIHIYDAKRDPIPINPFSIKEKDISKSADIVTDFFTTLFNLTTPQRNVVRKAYELCDNKISLDILVEALEIFAEEKEYSRSAKKVLENIKPFVKNVRFDNCSDDKWKELLYGKPKAVVMQLSALPDDNKDKLVDLILLDMMRFASANGSVENPFVCIIDEIQAINNSEKSPLGKILTIGRKFGISLWFATQYIGNNSTAVKRYQQAANTIIFDVSSDKDRKVIISSFLSGNKKIWQKIFAGLKPRICIVANTNTSSYTEYEKVTAIHNVNSIEEILSTDINTDITEIEQQNIVGNH